MRTRVFVSAAILTTLVVLFSSGCQQRASAPVPPEKQAKLAVEPEPAPPKVGPKPVVQPPKVQTKAAIDVNKPAPTITFENTVHDFGEIGVREKVTGEFKFKNTGDALLRIGKIGRTCGCTVPTLDKTDYQPGEEGIIKLQYTGQSGPGLVSKNIYVPSNDPKNRKVRLSIKGKVLRFVEAAPSRVTFALTQDVAAPKITLSSKDGQAFAVKGFTASGDAVSLDFDPNVPAQEFVFQPTVDRAKINRNRRGMLQFQLTHPRCGSVSIYYSVVAKFQAQPSRILLHNVKPAIIQTRDVVIKCAASEPFEIESVSSQKGYVELLSQQAEQNNTVRLKLKVTPPPQQDRQRYFSDTLIVKIKDEDEVVVACSGFYRSDVARARSR
jgi:hypothetical protein